MFIVSEKIPKLEFCKTCGLSVLVSLFGDGEVALDLNYVERKLLSFFTNPEIDFQILKLSCIFVL